LLIKGPADPIILTEEEGNAQQAEQIEVYAETDIGGFATKDILGNEISSDLFQKYDLIVINIWYTGCSPCIAEMPMLQEIYEKLPANVNLITICTDLLTKKGTVDDEAVKFVNEVMGDTKATFYTFITDKVLEKEISDISTIYPTTIFVNAEGKTVGTPYFGELKVEGYLEEIDKLLLNQK
jgi:thiol-disulfide isomerase/thioredoxin